MSDLKYWAGFRIIQGIGRARFSQLLDYFGNLEKAWHANRAELIASGLDNNTVDSIVTKRPLISLDAEMEKLEKHNVKVLTWNMPEFPSKLKEIYNVPPVLYVKGEFSIPEDEWAIGVVGTRRVTSYGRQVTEHIVRDLAQNKITVVSGLARGVDSVAHRTALETGGRTIAVLACGLDIIYPPENRKLAQQIIEQGALMSDYPLGTIPKSENFPPRNRIISGLSLGVLVTEAGEKSGSLITARLALEQNRDVFAVPGNIFSPMSKGTNHLIQDGAKLARDAQDILEEFNLTAISSQLEMKEIIPSNEMESQILKCLSLEPIHIDEICCQAQLPITTVSSTLAMMELKGMAKQVGGMNYVKY
jgi:DNA processing protein